MLWMLVILVPSILYLLPRSFDMKNVIPVAFALLVLYVRLRAPLVLGQTTVHAT